MVKTYKGIHFNYFYSVSHTKDLEEPNIRPITDRTCLCATVSFRTQFSSTQPSQHKPSNKVIYRKLSSPLESSVCCSVEVGKKMYLTAVKLSKLWFGYGLFFVCLNLALHSWGLTLKSEQQQQYSSRKLDMFPRQWFAEMCWRYPSQMLFLLWDREK